MIKITHERTFDFPVDRFIQFSHEDEMVEYLSESSNLAQRDVVDRVVTDDAITWKVVLAVEDQLPLAIRKLVGDNKLQWVQKFAMDLNTHVTTLEVEGSSIGKYFDVSGEFRIHDEGQKSGRIRLEGTIQSTIPVVGKSLEKVVHKRILEGWDRDFDFRMIYCHRRMQELYDKDELNAAERSGWEAFLKAKSAG